ncbi:BcPKS20 [Aspergillus affinis]|uniref:BcPKS20 n=1 Tax=Aspergillus affinis TaxID=1070780 RepID=UPI0022FE286B|nr:BcPKS20 [Aspergillus affinis]KAI9043577.1 BcPKS20 [Aspergillus affinis]
MNSTSPFHRIRWKPASLSPEPLYFTKVVFVVEESQRQSHDLAAYQNELGALGYTTAVITNPGEMNTELTPETSSIVVHIPHVPDSREIVYSAAVASCASLIAIAQVLATSQPARASGTATGAASVKLFSLAKNGDGINELSYAPLHGLARVLKMESPDFFGGLVDVKEKELRFPLSAIKYAQGFDVIRMREDEEEGIMQTAALEVVLPPDGEEKERRAMALDSESAYLITGGTSGIGLETAGWMVEQGARHLILVSRRGVESKAHDSRASALQARITEMEAHGATVHVLAIDLSLPGADSTLLQAINRLPSPVVKGVVHAAGTAGYHTLKACTPADIDKVFAPKVRGALSLDAVFPAATLDFFILVSSIGQLVGFPGQLSYAPANAFLDGLAVQRRREGDNCTSVQWTTWRGVGLSAQTKSATRMINKGMKDRGIADISKEEALAAWGQILALHVDQVAVVRALEVGADESLGHPILKDITPRRKRQAYSDYPKDAVAVVGMACRTAAGNTPDDLWQIVQTGESTIREIDAVRFPEASARAKNRLHGHFLSDIESFDHKFFGKSKREAAAMDPHQRLLLETTYHALETAGWVGGEHSASETHDALTGGHVTGCFIGMNTQDYALNSGSQSPSPYTAAGSMRSFVSGRVSHHFGWTGPSQNIDTACSSAMVAIHQACRALQVGECTRAIAGGVNLIPNTALFDALRTAGFLSETGACKTFDARADGYCRGEAVGVVILKPLDRALEDGDEIHGVLLSTGNNQNINSTSITNPVLQSQAALYKDVLARAGVNPHDVSYVEAHGTGTRAGDPIEVQGIRQVFGGPDRRSVLHMGGVKPNIGHSEAAAGVMSLIKVLLMFKHGKIPPQAQFKTLNPNIAALEPHHMAISTALNDWADEMRLAVVNSFGAAGSNAAAVVAPPPDRPASQIRPRELEGASQWPIFISAASKPSLLASCVKLEQYVGSKGNDITLDQLAFALATKGNWQIQNRFCTTASSLSDLQAQLRNAEAHVSMSDAKPVVLLLSGQNGTTAPAMRCLYDGSLLFRARLHECEEAMLALGLPSVLPTVLNGTGSGDSDAENDLVLRHAALFSIQYASAMSWIDSGVVPQAVCGQSFGECAALVITGGLTLEAGMKFITGRASILHRLWGPDMGLMMAIEADLVSSNMTPTQHLQQFTDKCQSGRVEIACYNGPNNYVVAGSTQDVEALETFLKEQKSKFTSNRHKIRFKVLRGIYAYHCHMADSILDACAELSASLPLKRPTPAFVSCHDSGEEEDWKCMDSTANIIGRNTRDPNYFGDAVNRIVARLGRSCTFLEAGFGGPITAMAQNALASTEHDHTFVALNGVDPRRSLAAATVSLWKTTRGVQFWLFNRSQSANFLTSKGRSIDLPPYQFEKHRHWIKYNPSGGGERHTDESRLCPHCHKSVVDFPYIVQENPQAQSDSDSTIRFSIDTRSQRYQQLISGHVVVGSPLCPAGMYLELVAHAVCFLQDGSDQENEIGFEAVEIKAPLGLDTRRSVKCTLDMKRERSWRFEILSTHKDEKDARPTSHCAGVVYYGKVQSDKNAGANTTSTWTHMSHLLEDPETDALRGAMVYRTFTTMVTYSPPYRGLRYIVGKGSEGAGEIDMPKEKSIVARAPNENIMDALLLDYFMQMAGIFVHSLRAVDQEEGPQSNTPYICTGIGLVRPAKGSLRGRKYRAYTRIVRDDRRSVLLDLLAFDSTSQQIIWSAHGLRFTGVPRTSLVKALAGANPGVLETEIVQYQQPVRSVPPTPSQSKGDEEVLIGVQQVLSRCLDVPVANLQRNVLLEDLGIDSLVSAEILAGISDQFNVDISTTDLVTATAVASLCDLISSRRHGSEPLSDNESQSTPVAAKVWQSTVMRILSQALDLETAEIAPSSRLGDLGADSLVAPEIMSNLKEALGVDISLADFASTTDVMSLCDLVKSALGYTPSGSSSAPSDDTPCSELGPASDDQEPAIKSTSNANVEEYTPKPPPATATSMLLHRGVSAARNLFLMPGGPGYGTVFTPLGQLLAQTFPSLSISIYALNSPYTDMKLPSPDKITHFHDIPTAQDLATSYTAEIKRRQPHGPYLIGGYSFGGILALESMRQLLSAGDEVEKLVLLDAPCPCPPTPSTPYSIRMPDALLQYIRPIRSAFGAGEVTLALEQLGRYRYTELNLPGQRTNIPSTILVSAKQGADSIHTQEERGFSVPDAQRGVTEWILNDRVDDGPLGWERVMGEQNVKVIRAEGHHYSFLRNGLNMKGWVQSLFEMLLEN